MAVFFPRFHQQRGVPPVGLRAIIAHELAHIHYYRAQSRMGLLSLGRLLLPTFNTRFERQADLEAIALGYGPGLQEFRKWLYINIPAQLTWMDAKIGDRVVTPRAGKPVEIQGLWYNAVCILRELAEAFDDSGPELFLRELGNQVRESFAEQFWNPRAGCLYDVINGSQCDAAIRPN